jgi:hypothetical protein
MSRIIKTLLKNMGPQIEEFLESEKLRAYIVQTIEQSESAGEAADRFVHALKTKLSEV